MIVSQTDLKAGYYKHKKEIDKAISDVLDSGWYVLGSNVSCFENEFAGYLGAQHTVGVGSGTDAIVISLKALGVGDGDAVITVSNTAVATIAAIRQVGAIPVLVDVDENTFTIDLNKYEETVKYYKESRSNDCLNLVAAIPVHLYGQPVNMNEFMEISRRYNLAVVEDCAQAHGAKTENQITGTWGDISAFSFYPTKNLAAFGDAGALATNDDRLYESCLSLRQYGWKDRYVSEVEGMNSRLDEMQAAILRVNLGYLDRNNQHRRFIAEKYNNLISTEKYDLPVEADNACHVYHQYVIKACKRDALMEYFAKNEIQTAIHYPVPVHKQPAYSQVCHVGIGGLDNTEKSSGSILSLPMHPYLKDEEVSRVSDVLNSFQN